jgi:hypothetical protein
MVPAARSDPGAVGNDERLGGADGRAAPWRRQAAVFVLDALQDAAGALRRCCRRLRADALEQLGLPSTLVWPCSSVSAVARTTSWAR